MLVALLVVLIWTQQMLDASWQLLNKGKGSDLGVSGYSRKFMLFQLAEIQTHASQSRMDIAIDAFYLSATLIPMLIKNIKSDLTGY